MSRMLDPAGRIAMTTACRDCDSVPKVPDAGTVRDTPAGRVQVMHNGLLVVAGGYDAAWETEIIRRLRGHHEPQQEKAFHTLLGYLGPAAVMFEPGCHWAYYSLWFRSAVPDGVIHLCEPDPNAAAIGAANLRLNGVSANIHPVRIGRQSAASTPFRRASDGQIRDVRSLTLDDFLAEHDIPTVDLLHADIQGTEADLLLGAEKTVRAGAVRFLMLSTHHHRISHDPLTHQRCLKHLRGIGANILCEHSVSESFSGDGLIVAALRPADAHLPPIPISRNRAARSLFGEVEYDLELALREIERLREELAHRSE